jgi:predicted O-linked N-acetylglucosamine transferase (SPINDLY family)
MPSVVALQKKIDRAMEHQRANDLVRAEAIYRQVLAKEPRQPAALHLLGALLLQTDRDEEAAKHLERALSRVPDHALFLANLGEAYRRLGRARDGVSVLARAVALKPDLAEARYTLGLVLHAEGRKEEAVQELRRATAIKPTLLKPHARLAAALLELGRLDEALEACTRALEIDGQCPDFHVERGLVLRDQGRIAEALSAFRTALRHEPDYAPAHAHLVYALALDPDQDARSIATEAARWSQIHAAPLTARQLPHDNERDPNRRLRVGYVSPHLYNHCHSLFLVPLFAHHDREQVEVLVYASVERPDELTERVRTIVDRYVDVSRKNDAEVAAQVRSDGVDVLVDLAMHLPGGRLPIFALKPAPVQVTWLAYPGTTGLAAIDYRITDVHLDPPGAPDEGVYAEQSVRLPETFWCYDPLTERPAVSELPALGKGHFTFGCLNSFNKTNPAVLAAWAKVLGQVEGSRLVLVARPGATRCRARETFRAAGVEPERVTFFDYIPRLEYLALYREIDLCLDTFPHNGGTTTLDACWMGVPVVTLAGKTAVGRAGLSIATNLQLLEVVARTADEYAAIAVGLARDLPRLARLRSGLRQRMQESALMDAPRFARNLEGAYRGMWRRWCAA